MKKIPFASKGVWYVPKYEGNRDEADPFMVLLKPMKPREYQRLISANVGNIKVDKKGEINIGDRAWAEIGEDALKRSLMDVRGMVAEDLSTGEEVKITKDNYHEYMPADLHEELLLAVLHMSVLKEGASKNFNLPSSSGYQAMNHGNGNAKSDSTAIA